MPRLTYVNLYGRRVNPLIINEEGRLGSRPLDKAFLRRDYCSGDGGFNLILNGPPFSSTTL